MGDLIGDLMGNPLGHLFLAVYLRLLHLFSAARMPETRLRAMNSADSRALRARRSIATTCRSA